MWRVVLLPALVASLAFSQAAGDDPRELYRRGLEHYNAGDAEGAVELLARAAKLKPDVPDYRFHLGLAHLKLGNAREAAREFEAAIGLMGMRRDTRLKEPMVLTHAGIAYLRLADLKTARMRLELAVKRDPELADAHYGLGLLAQKEGDDPKAIEEFGAAIEIDQDHPEANIAMARWLESRGAFGEAREHLRHATHGAPENFDVLMALGSLAYREGALEEAAEAYELARRLRPDDRETSYNLGTLRLAQEQYEESVELLEPLVLVAEGEELHLRAAFNLAQAYSKLLRFESAKQVLESLLEREAAFPGAAFALGLVEEALGDDLGAERAYRKAIEDFPRQPRAYLNLAVVLERLERRAEALVLLKQSLELPLEESQSRTIKLAIESLESSSRL